jgi:uncharacterized lipoprotein YddW (UPF0748 family)
MKNLIQVLFLSITFISLTLSQTIPVKGVWLTNVDSDVLRSKQNIKDAVALCDSIGINTIYVVTWNKGFTTYPSKVMSEFCGVSIYPDYAGRDPIKELIEEAHAKNIKVFGWFEFGFSSSYNLDGGMILKLKPGWKSINNRGELVKKNGFEWMNGFDPQVQDFILSLIVEFVTNYNVDGIQGDDRLPAMPVESGYDKYTIDLYKKTHNGNKPPEDFRDSSWIQWRADIMNSFMGKIYTSVKKVNKDLIISMAPSIYPWSKEEYLQDWPQWIEDGYIEQICPQLYRENITAYLSLLKDIVNDQIKKVDSNKFYPGVLLKVGPYYPSLEFLKQMILENRKCGVNGEVFFFYEGLKKYRDFFLNDYKNIK